MGMIINPYRFSVGVPPATTLYDEIMSDSPFGYWQLGEAAAPVSYADSSGNAYHLDQITATVTAGSAALVSPGTSADFDGSAGKIRCDNNEFGAALSSAFQGAKPFTIVAVIRVDNLSIGRVIFHAGNFDNANEQGIWLVATSSGELACRYVTNATNTLRSAVSASSVIATSTTYIVHARRFDNGVDAAVGTVWVNGVDETSATDFVAPVGIAANTANGGTRIAIGCLQAATPFNHFDGRLQHVAIFDSALSDARILAHAEAAGLA